MERSKVNAIHKDLQAAVAKVAAQHGVSVTRVSGTFGGNILTSKIEFSADGESKKEKNLKRDLEIAMSSFDLNKTTAKTGETLIGYNSRGKSYPWIMIKNGKRYKIATDHARLLFG